MRFATTENLRFGVVTPTLVARSSRSCIGVGCRDSAPDDLILQEETTEALVFVKTDGEETLNRSWAEGNLYKLSPISPDGVVTPITNFTGAAHLRSVRLVRRQEDPVLDAPARRRQPQHLRDQRRRHRAAPGDERRRSRLRPALPARRPHHVHQLARREMDEYNHAPAEHLYICDVDGGNLERVSFNQSDDFDPTLLPDGRIVYTRWEHFGTQNRFPLFFTNPDGTAPFHVFGPHDRNFFHAAPTPDGRLIAIESTMIEEDAGPIAVLKPERARPTRRWATRTMHWDVLTPQVNNDGEPWPYGAFKYPFPIGGNRYVASYTLPAAPRRTSTTASTRSRSTRPAPARRRSGHVLDRQPDVPLQRPGHERVRRAAAGAAREAAGHRVDGRPNVDYGVFLAKTCSTAARRRPGVPGARRRRDRQHRGDRRRPDPAGEMNDFSANEFEKRALLGFAPVQPDGSFRIKVPANTPISFATLDDAGPRLRRQAHAPLRAPGRGVQQVHRLPRGPRGRTDARPIRTRWRPRCRRRT